MIHRSNSGKKPCCLGCLNQVVDYFFLCDKFYLLIHYGIQLQGDDI